MNGVLLRFITGLLVLVSISSSAGIVVNSTRVIYSADKKEVTVSLKNTGTHAALVQSWLDTGDPTAVPKNINVPFVIMPPITRIDGGKGQTLRLIYTGGTLPADRESIFWLNVLAVPPKKNDANHHLLNVAYQTRIKLFYRPTNQSINVDAAAKKLQWTTASGALNVTNPTPYYISLLNVNWISAGKNISVAGEMISPYGQLRLAIKETPMMNTPLNYTIIDDLGRAQSLSSVING